MTRCLDIHTHHDPPQPGAVVAVSPGDFNPIDGQYYSVGIHPWDTTANIPESSWEELRNAAENPAVKALGEAGLDKINGGLFFRQMIVFKRQIDISEQLNKPLIIHDVKAHDVIVGLKRDLNPTQKWAIHGFRGKPTVAKMMTDAGIYLSFGEKFNPETPLSVPENFILAETDDSPLTIEEVISNLSSNMGRDVTTLIAANTINFLDIETITSQPKN